MLTTNDSYLFTDEHRAFRDQLRRFVQKEIAPNADDWEEKGIYDKAIIKRMGELGFLGIKYPVEYGGQDADVMMNMVFLEEICRGRSLGFAMSLFVHTDMASPALNNVGTHDQKDKYLRGVCSGDKFMAVAITEPNHGSDAANIETRAILEEDYYRLNGTKTFITNGTQADFIDVVARTGGPGYKGVSLLLVDTDTPGFSVARKLEKTGLLASDTTEIVFEDVMVPKENLLGKENEGFYALMTGLESERISLAVLAYMAGLMALEESIQFAKERIQFNRPIGNFQAINHQLADMYADIEAAKRIVYHAALLYHNKIKCPMEVSAAKFFACEAACRVVQNAVQIHGGYGYMREYYVDRLYRDVRLFNIGGGTREIMKDIVAKEMGFRSR
jgi:alkylation response protein AidB-like acyl-CoA dehydrogenase